MVAKFEAVMAKLAVLGQDPSTLVDCSDVIPVPKPFTGSATFPAGLSHNDVEQACATSAFPTLKTDPGPVTSVAPVYVPILPLEEHCTDELPRQPSLVNSFSHSYYIWFHCFFSILGCHCEVTGYLSLISSRFSLSPAA